MGTWNYKPFGNDTACDWVFALEKTKDSSLIVETLKKFTVDEVIDSPDGEEMVAAASIVLAASKDKVTGLPKEVKEWVLLNAYVPSQPEIELAVQALQQIICADTSDLCELWVESGNATKWKTHTQTLIDALRLIDITQLPQRKPKKKGIPRSLKKLCEHPDVHTNPKIQQKIREKLEKLDNVNVASKATDFDVPLTLVAKNGVINEVKYLIEERGANIEKRNEQLGTGTALVYAAMNNQLEVVNYLINKGAQIHITQTFNFPDREEIELTYSPALMSAVRTAKSEMIDLLIKSGADPLQQDLNGETLIHKAAESGNHEIIGILVQLGVEIDANKNLPHIVGTESALHYAVNRHQYESCKALLENGADPNIIDEFNGEKYQWKQTPLDCIDLDDKKNQKLYDLLVSFGAKHVSEL